MTQRVQLTLSCLGLRDADIFSKSDPLVTVFDDCNNELGRTECIDNELNPNFEEKIILQYDGDEHQKLIFKVWDIDDYENDINKADFLGDMDCSLQELVECSSKFSKPLRYEGSDFGKIFIKTDILKDEPKKGGKKGKKGKKSGNKKKETVRNDSVSIKSEPMDEVDDTFKSCGLEDAEVEDSLQDALHSDTMMTQGFIPTDRYTPTREHENKFTSVTHPLRPVAGADGYLSDPGVNESNDNYTSMTGSNSKPYHFIPTRTSLYDMSLTPLEDISCITPHDPGVQSKSGSTVKPAPPDNGTYGHLTGDYMIKDEDTYEEMQSLPVNQAPPPPHGLRLETVPLSQGVRSLQRMPLPQRSPTSQRGHLPPRVPLSQGVPIIRSHDAMTTTGTSMTPSHRATVNTGTSPIWLDEQLDTGTQVSPRHTTPIAHENNANNWTTPRQVTSPPAYPPSIHNIPFAGSELRWCKYSSNDSSLTEDKSSEPDKTMFYSFTDTNRQAAASPNSRRPPVLEDFERSWDNVLNDTNSPDWSAVDSQQWRTWFEFYKANSKVKKMKSLLVGTMMGTRECVKRGAYQTPLCHSIPATPHSIPATPHSNPATSNSNEIPLHSNGIHHPTITVQLPVNKTEVLLEDKSILHQPPPLNFSKTDINVINVDPIQVCLHLQKSGYIPGLFVPANPHTPGGEWRTGGIGPLEEFIRRSNYYTCVDPVDRTIEEGSKRNGSLGLIGPTDCQINTNVTVFRQSQQHNYTFFSKPKQLNVLSVTPLPKSKRDKENRASLSKEEVHLLKKKLTILIYTAATHGADCLVLSPHLTEGRRVPHRHVAQIIQTVVEKHQGMIKRVIIAIEPDVIFHDISKEILSVYNKQFPEGHITLPSLPTASNSQEILLWHWMGDNNNWYPYDPKQNEVIDAIYLRGESKMSMKGTDSTHPGYLVDFNHFTVKSLSSGASRKIGRFKLVYDKVVKKSPSRPVGNWVSAAEETNKLYETAGDETLLLNQPMPVWQWLCDENTWCHYSPEQSNKLETAYLQHGTACVILNIAETRFSVNTKTRIQTNTKTGKQRKVQRTVKSVPVSPPPRATSTPTPPAQKLQKSAIYQSFIVWEHQGTDKSWLPFDATTIDLMEAAYEEGKPRLTVVFNNQAYWIYFEPYYVLVDPNINEEYAIRRGVSQQQDIAPLQLFPQSLVTPKQQPKVPVTPMSNSTMLDQTLGETTKTKDTLFTTASDFSDVLKDIKPATKLHQRRERSISADSIKYDSNQNQMRKTFLRHPSVQARHTGSVVRDPTREFAWEWEDSRTGLWHTLPEFISCFLEPASKIQSHGGVRTSKLTNGNQQMTVRADFTINTITGHLPGRPDIVTRLRRVEVCSNFS